MKAAIICFYEAYPPISGAASVSFNIARFLPGETLLIQVGSGPRMIEAHNVSIITIPGGARSNLGKTTGLPGRIRAIVDEIMRFGPDLVILEGASWAFYHLLLMRALRRTALSARIVYHSHNVEYLLRRKRNGHAIAAVTRWAEGHLVHDADISTAVSEVDRDHFRRLYGTEPTLLPNGVDFDRFAEVSAEAIARMRAKYRLDAHTMLFSGFYAYPPNREAIDFLVHTLMPIMRERFSSATLALTGGGAPYHEPWIRNVGSVPYEDLPAFVAACGVAVAPIFSGSGTRLKILEAMAAGVPVVATEKAAEGLGLRHREHALFADNHREFARAIGELLDNHKMAARFAYSARQKVETEFSWRMIIGDFQNTINTVLCTSRRPDAVPSTALVHAPIPLETTETQNRSTS